MKAYEVKRSDIVKPRMKLTAEAQRAQRNPKKKGRVQC